MVHIYSGILLSHKKKKIMPFAATWMELETLILSEVSQKEKGKYRISHIWNLIYGTNEPFHLKELMHLENRLWLPKGRRRDWDGWGAWG